MDIYFFRNIYNNSIFTNSEFERNSYTHRTSKIPLPSVQEMYIYTTFLKLMHDRAHIYYRLFFTAWTEHFLSNHHFKSAQPSTILVNFALPLGTPSNPCRKHRDKNSLCREIEKRKWSLLFDVSVTRETRQALKACRNNFRDEAGWR